jgi:hypothetical protein
VKLLVYLQLSLFTCRLARARAPEVQRAVEDDLGAYPSMCTKLRCGSATACLYVDGGCAMCYSRFGIGTGVTAGVLMRV